MRSSGCDPHRAPKVCAFGALLFHDAVIKNLLLDAEPEEHPLHPWRHVRNTFAVLAPQFVGNWTLSRNAQWDGSFSKVIQAPFITHRYTSTTRDVCAAFEISIPLHITVPTDSWMWP